MTQASRDDLAYAVYLIQEQIWLDRQTPPAWAVKLENRLNRKLGDIMGAVQDAVDAVSAQLDKAKAEIVAAIAALEQQVADGQAPDLTALKAAAQGLDDVVPDAPVEEPPVEPPVE